MDKFYQFLTIAGIVVYWLIVAGTTLRVVFKRRAVSVSVAWLMIIFILPFVGVILYYMFGELNLGRKRADRAQSMFTPYRTWFSQVHECVAHQPELLDGQISHIHALCSNRTNIPALCGNELQLFTTADEVLSAVLEDIKQAKHNIRMEFYIWHAGGLVEGICAALILASKRGVKIQILADSAGSKEFLKPVGQLNLDKLELKSSRL